MYSVFSEKKKKKWNIRAEVFRHLDQAKGYKTELTG